MKPLKNSRKTYNIISKVSVKVTEKAVRNIYIPVPIYSEMKNANMEVKFAHVVCNWQHFNKYSSDWTFLKAKVMITEGLSKTFSFKVIFRGNLHELHCSGRITRHLCLFVYFLLAIIFSQGLINKSWHFRFKSAEWAGNSSCCFLPIKQANMFQTCKLCFIT